MNTARGSIRRSQPIKMAAAVGIGLITAGLAAAKPVPAHDSTIDQTPAVTMTADESMLREGSRDATPGELAAREIARGPQIGVDGLFGPKTNAASQIVPF